MTQIERAAAFAELHEKGRPLILYNIWDAGSARAVADAGAPALATGSWSVAAAQGYSDGEHIPLSGLEMIVHRIIESVDLPLSVDFEGGFAVGGEQLARNVTRIIQAGAIGINFEDQIIGGEGLYLIPDQQLRLETIRNAANALQIPLFINARTDVFLKDRNPGNHEALLDHAVERALAYGDAGANGIFMPGLTSPALIARAVEAIPLPLNIMMMPGVPDPADLALLGVARVSYGAGSYFEAMQGIKDAATRLYERFTSVS